jgi:hypothetical protein
LVIGTGADGALPIVGDVTEEAERRGVRLVVLPTAEALEDLGRGAKGTNAILHVTC